MQIKANLTMARGSLINILVLLAMLFSGVYCETIFNYENRCPYSVWLAASPDIGEAMWEYPSDTLTIFITPDQWTGSIWLRTGCVTDDSLHVSCATGDCGTTDIYCNGGPPTAFPVTLLNFDIKNSIVKYELSLIHGYNLPVRVVPIGATFSCPIVECATDVTRVCPTELLYKNSNGTVVGCQSPCDALKDPKYCCTGAFGSPEACQPNQYSLIFKKACPLAHTYPRDSNPPMYQCNAAKSYNITFCP